MSHSNISIFVPHVGCPHKCAFCDQRTITGKQDIPRADDVRRICTMAMEQISEPKDTEIAFFGGSFTAIPKNHMLELLEAAKPFIGGSGFKGIRCSTRPDCIDDSVLKLLKEYGVTAIELGAQSMSDKVLEANERGHTAADVENAARLIRSYGIELGLQMMIGLYKSDISDERQTVSKINALRPDTVRIYPVVILEHTRLAELFRSGEYQPFDFETAVSLSAEAMQIFHESGIRVIKCGLHASEFVEQDMVGGFYHPAFRELCEGRIYRSLIETVIESLDDIQKDSGLTFAVRRGCISKAVGHKRENVRYFAGKGVRIRLIEENGLPLYKAELR